MRVIFNFIKFVVVFAVVFFLTTVACEIAWEKFVDGYLYDCTDPLFGYLTPDGWVGNGKWPVAAVPKVTSGRSINDPDEIKAGWSVAGLWCVWSALFASSVVVSFASAAALAGPKRKQPVAM